MIAAVGSDATAECDEPKMVPENSQDIEETVPVDPTAATKAVAGPLAVPEQIGPYHIEGELSRGGMGVVYVGMDSRLHRRVAIKMLPEHFADDPGALGRLENEARLLASLNHPSIATIYSLECVDGYRFFTLELIRGETLAGLIARGDVPPGRFLSLFYGIAGALQYAHESGVIHCDLKPANVLVDSRDTPKILDFGIARAVGGGARSEGPRSQSAETGASGKSEPALFGTPGYMSPEQIAGRAPDARSDIWALGCMLYEALTGRRPFRGETRLHVLSATIREEPDWSALPPLPPRLRETLTRCLEKNPARRLAELSSFVEILDEAATSLRYQEADPASRVLTHTLGKGDTAPHFELGAPGGEVLRSRELLAKGPLVVIFYRGVWCPVCTDELRDFQRRLSEIDALGGTLVAISPQLEHHNHSIRQEQGITYHVLSDPGNEIAKAFGVAFELPPDLRMLQRSLGLDLQQFNGDDSWVLPMPATFVVGQDGAIVYAATSPDPTMRPDPALAVRALRQLAVS